MKHHKKLILSSPLLLLLLLVFNPVKAVGQAVPASPDCGPIFINSTYTAGSAATIAYPSTTGYNNRTTGCQFWVVMYQGTATGGTLTSVSLQNTNGAATPGAFADWTGTVLTGVNPNTSSTNAISTYSTGCVSGMACTTNDSWIRVLITRNNFVGAINGVMYGYKNNPGAGGGGSSGSGCPGTVATPCVVDGPTAAGAAPTTPPVLVAGQDGAPGNVRTVQTDSVGQLIPSNASFAGADGVSNTELSPTGAGAAQLYFRILPYVFGGTTNDRQFVCNNQALVTITAGTDAVIVTGVAATNIRICHLDFASDAAATFTIRQGTGSTCGTNTASLAGPYPTVGTLAMDYQPTAALRTTVAARDVCIHSGSSVTIGGVVIYAQF